MKRIELLAPGGDLDAIKAAILGGADAIYCGLDKFNARHRAQNITFDDLGGILALAHKHDCRIFLTLNIMMVESDLPVVIDILNRLVNTSVDGVIVQDLGVFYLLSAYFPGLKPHASTQLTTHNEGQIKFLSRLSASRVNLSRELSLDEIRPLALAAKREGVSTEVFVHGSYCISFSGICYMSSVQGGSSGNRGLCSQPCREQYVPTPRGEDFPLNLKDNSAYFVLKSLADAGVDAMKIEGRMKAFHYVYTVTNAYRRRLQGLYENDAPVDESGDLYKVYNRGFSNGFLLGDVGREMFSDNPRNHSAAHLRQRDSARSTNDAKGPPPEPYDEMADFKAGVRQGIEGIRAAKAPLALCISGSRGTPLKVKVETPDTSFATSSDSCLVLQHITSAASQLNAEVLRDRFKALNDTEHFIAHLDVEELQPALFVPHKELKSIKMRLLFMLNGKREFISPVGVPALPGRSQSVGGTKLAVLIASPRDVFLSDETAADVHFLLPNALSSEWSALAEFFAQHPRLIPFFPSVLVGEHYAAALEFLHRLQPERIVTNNTGVAYEAWRAGIPWVAGPQLNTANSFSMASLKENFACCGAFVSNELNELQIKRLAPPDDFALHYSIYHPIELLTSRQCLFQQVVGCEKDSIDTACVGGCEKSSTITNLKGERLFLDKTKGSYCSAYHHANCLNTEIVSAMPALFSRFCIDLRDIQTETKMALDKSRLIQLFEQHIRGHDHASQELQRSIAPTTNEQYRRGI